jgi:hypothetical protein
MMGFPWGTYLLLMAKIATVTVVMLTIIWLIPQEAISNLLGILCYSAILAMITIGLYSTVLSRDDRKYAIQLIKRKLHKK